MLPNLQIHIIILFLTYQKNSKQPVTNLPNNQKTFFLIPHTAHPGKKNGYQNPRSFIR